MKKNTLIKRNFVGILLMFLLILTRSNAQVGIEHYKIYSVKLGKEINITDLITDCKETEVLFFGEEHNDSVAHYLEKTMFEMFVASYN
jgi:hypothetical protein